MINLTFIANSVPELHAQMRAFLGEPTAPRPMTPAPLPAFIAAESAQALAEKKKPGRKPKLPQADVPPSTPEATTEDKPVVASSNEAAPPAALNPPTKDDMIAACKRLSERIGSDKALEVVRETLKSLNAMKISDVAESQRAVLISKLDSVK